MKKAISFFLVVIMIVSVVAPSITVSAATTSKYPIIRLRGNGESIVDSDGNTVYDFQYDTSNLADDVVEVCMPHLLKGISTGDFDDYYDALYQKLSDIYGDAKLDENGEPTGGTSFSAGGHADNEANMRKPAKSGYSLYEYKFHYDWRLDPLYTADLLNDYINAILATTKKEKVSLYGNCLGGTPILAYLAKYGSDKIDTVCFDAVVSNGCEMINDVFTANMNFSAEAALRFADGEWKEDITDTLGDPLLFDLLYSTIKMLNSVGVSQEVIDFVIDKVYNSIGKNVTGIFARAGMGTWPSYWSSVEVQNYELAKTVVFGEENGELRQTYAGLIEKLDNYYETVTSKLPEILRETKENGTKVCIVAKYGSQLFPYYGSCDEISDQWVSASNASFGATTCPVGEKFSDEYVAQQEAAGLGKYVCIDRTVDASTCVLPDNTWFVKGASHENWADSIEALSYAVCCNALTDINSDPNFPQFLYFDKETGKLNPLTEENMNCEEYYDTDTGSTENLSKTELIKKRLKVLFEFLDRLIAYIKKLLGTDKA